MTPATGSLIKDHHVRKTPSGLSDGWRRPTRQLLPVAFMARRDDGEGVASYKVARQP